MLPSDVICGLGWACWGREPGVRDLSDIIFYLDVRGGPCVYFSGGSPCLWHPGPLLFLCRGGRCGFVSNNGVSNNGVSSKASTNSYHHEDAEPWPTE